MIFYPLLMSRSGFIVAATMLFLRTPTANAENLDAPTLDVMFYNVLNLFDTEHDAGKDDWSFLPKDFPGKMEACQKISNPGYRQDCEETDWTPAHLQVKIDQLVRVIRSDKNQIPDLLGLCEVENERAVGALASALGYKDFIVSDSPDERGIDVALAYRPSAWLRFVQKSEHTIPSSEINTKPTRNILEVEFTVSKQESLHVFVNHWPSQAAPAAVRVEVAKVLMRIVNERLAQNPRAHILVMGDFNVTNTDQPNPIASVLLAKESNTNPLLDVHDLFSSGRTTPREAKLQTPMGTYFYPPKMSWDRLDRFFVNDSLHDGTGLDVKPESYRIYLPSFALKTYKYENPEHFLYGTQVTNTPIYGDPRQLDPEKAGFSDHFSIRMQLVIK